jgi:hypothetical protein
MRDYGAERGRRAAPRLDCLRDRDRAFDAALKALGLKREPRDVTLTLQTYLDAAQQSGEDEDSDASVN